MSSKQFIIVADTSGSMAEGNRILLLRNLCRYVVQRFEWDERLINSQLHFVSWGQEVLRILPEANGCVPLPSPGGKARQRMLVRFLENMISQSNVDSRVILMSDDDMNAEDLFDSLRGKGIPMVYVGVAPELEELKRESPSWHAEDISTALSELLSDIYNESALPEKISDIVWGMESPVVSSSEEDEW